MECQYLEPEKHFQEKIDKIKAKDGNHMILITSIIMDRERRKKIERKYGYGSKIKNTRYKERRVFFCFRALT